MVSNILADLGIQDQNHGVAVGGNFRFWRIHRQPLPCGWQAHRFLSTASNDDYERVMTAATDAFVEWRKWTAPQRGEVVRQYGDALRAKKDSLGALVSYEMGKSYQEGLGEGQEMIDICDFAVGQAVNSTASPCTQSAPTVMYEQYTHLVWSASSARSTSRRRLVLNTALAWISGDVCVWKPSEKAPLCSLACQHIWNEVAEANNLPAGVSCIVTAITK